MRKIFKEKTFSLKMGFNLEYEGLSALKTIDDNYTFLSDLNYYVEEALASENIIQALETIRLKSKKNGQFYIGSKRFVVTTDNIFHYLLNDQNFKELLLNACLSEVSNTSKILLEIDGEVFMGRVAIGEEYRYDILLYHYHYIYDLIEQFFQDLVQYPDQDVSYLFETAKYYLQILQSFQPLIIDEFNPQRSKLLKQIWNEINEVYIFTLDRFLFKMRF